MGILEAFATDNLTVEPVSHKGSEEYEKAKALSYKLNEELCSKLNEEQKKLLEEYLDAYADENHLYAVDRFVAGYRLGVLMTTEVYAGKQDPLSEKELQKILAKQDDSHQDDDHQDNNHQDNNHSDNNHMDNNHPDNNHAIKKTAN